MKRLVVVSIAVVALLALCAIPAFAEGYNNGSWNFTTNANETTYAANAGIYVRTPHAGATQVTSFAGPHGGYDTSTNKCQDCHSTHYATGSYRLLRASSRETACDFCHTGGGGSKTNIMMDNDYNTSGVDSTTTMGYGTGHTLGYTGNAPADIDPAFTDTAGLACFDCHTPHGNSARVLQTFADPGRKMSGAAVNHSPVVFNIYKVGDPEGQIWYAGPTEISSAITTANGAPLAGTYWGVTTAEGNFVVVTRAAGGNTVSSKPVWPKGRFLLLKDPDPNDGDDSVLATSAPAGTSTGVDTKKFAINWDDPIGPADAAYGGNDAARAADPTWNNTTTTNAVYDAPNGIATVSEMCADCHGGAAGLSTQRANVWKPNTLDNGLTGDYMLAYSHDAQPRH